MNTAFRPVTENPSTTEIKKNQAKIFFLLYSRPVL